MEREREAGSSILPLAAVMAFFGFASGYHCKLTFWGEWEGYLSRCL